MKVCLVGSSGGHLTHLYMLKDFWKDKDRFWVTFDKEDARSILENEKVIQCVCFVIHCISVCYDDAFFLYEKRSDHRRETRRFS